MRIYSVFNYFLSLTLAVILISCGAGGDNQGLEYAPNMYHSVPYEPLSQITDEDAGEATQFLNNTRDGHGEYYNSNPLNAHGMTMRTPAPNTVPRKKDGFLPYRIPKDSLEIAAEIESPIDSTMAEAAIKDGKALYGRYCEHCHGSKGEADGLVAEKYPGVANLQGVAYKNITEGHIFHVITWGKGLMGAHGSQVSPEDRWKIAKFVKSIQK
ncbi:MAG: cytochrome c [Fulvivirga sp.]|uniref:c-type cytochrome n=1 Tax=Fulvivirga sp. TaxID=1931237 RepID=UPI0032ECB205